MNITNSSSDDDYIVPEDKCDYIDDFSIEERFYLAVVCGVTLSIISIVFNSFIFLVFVTNQQHRKSPNLYLLLLSFFDVFIGVSYIAVMALRVIFHYQHSTFLKNIWVLYMVPMLTTSHIAITSSVYLIAFASIERYCITVNNFLVAHLQKHRPLLAFIAIMCGVVSKGTMIQEVTIQHREECMGEFNEYRVVPSQLVMQYPWFTVYWRFYFRNIFTILAPFFILLIVNALLLHKLQKHVKQSKYIEQIHEKQNVKLKKARIRAATRSLVILVCVYLLTNSLSVVVALWEFLDFHSLRYSFTTFYVLSVDFISILTIVAGSLRLPIYAVCQPLLRKEMIQFISQPWHAEKRSRRMTLLEGLNTSSPLVETEDSPSIAHVEFV